MSATSLIQTNRPARFAGLALASGIGLAAFAPPVPVLARPALRLVVGVRPPLATPREVAA